MRERLRDALQGRERVTLYEALALLDLADGRETEREIVGALRALGWRRVQVREDGARVWAYVRGTSGDTSYPVSPPGANLVVTRDTMQPDPKDNHTESHNKEVVTPGGDTGYDVSPPEVVTPPAPPRALPPTGEIVSYARPAPVVAPARPPCRLCGSRRARLTVGEGVLSAVPCPCVLGPCAVPGCASGWVVSSYGVQRCPGCAPSSVAAAISSAQIPLRYLPYLSGTARDAGYTQTTSQETAAREVERWCRSLPAPGVASLGEVRGLLLWGGYGSGKTALAARALLFSLTRGHRGIFWEWGSFLTTLRESYDGDAAPPEYAASRTGILVLDELAAPRTDWQGERLSELLRERYRRRLPTILTSNLTPRQIPSVIGGALWSRLTETVSLIECAGPDRRAALGGVR